MVRRNHALGDDIRGKWCQKAPWFSRDRCVIKPWKAIFNSERPFLGVKDFTQNLPQKTLKNMQHHYELRFCIVDAIATWIILILFCWSHLVVSRRSGHFVGWCLGEMVKSPDPVKEALEKAAARAARVAVLDAAGQEPSPSDLRAPCTRLCMWQEVLLETTLVTSYFNQKTPIYRSRNITD